MEMNNCVGKGRYYLDKGNEFTVCTALCIVLFAYSRTTSILVFSLSLFMILFFSFLIVSLTLYFLSLCWGFSPLTVFQV